MSTRQNKTTVQRTLVLLHFYRLDKSVRIMYCGVTPTGTTSTPLSIASIDSINSFSKRETTPDTGKCIARNLFFFFLTHFHLLRRGALRSCQQKPRENSKHPRAAAGQSVWCGEKKPGQIDKARREAFCKMSSIVLTSTLSLYTALENCYATGKKNTTMCERHLLVHHPNAAHLRHSSGRRIGFGKPLLMMIKSTNPNKLNSDTCFLLKFNSLTPEPSWIYTHRQTAYKGARKC